MAARGYEFKVVMDNFDKSFNFRSKDWISKTSLFKHRINKQGFVGTTQERFNKFLSLSFHNQTLRMVILDNWCYVHKNDVEKALQKYRSYLANVAVSTSAYGQTVPTGAYIPKDKKPSKEDRVSILHKLDEVFQAQVNQAVTPLKIQVESLKNDNAGSIMRQNKLKSEVAKLEEENKRLQNALDLLNMLYTSLQSNIKALVSNEKALVA